MLPDRRDHTYITFRELRDYLGMTGIPVKVWVEPDSDYVHMITIPEDSDPNGIQIAEGGYVDIRSRTYRQEETVSITVKNEVRPC